MSGPLLLKQMVVSNAEISFYLIGYTMVTSLMFYSAYQSTRKEAFAPFVTPDALGILVDRSCDMWSLKLLVMRKLTWLLVLYVVLSKAIRQRVSHLHWSLVCGLLGTTFVFYVVGFSGLLFMLAIAGYHFFAAALSRSRVALWIAHVIYTFCIVDSAIFRKYYWKMAPNEFEKIMYIVMALIAIRCLMFFDDVLRCRDTVPLLSKVNVCTFLHFLFYPPTTLFGPIFTYGEFKKSLFNPVKTRYLYSAFRVFRLVLWGLLLHASFYIHYRAFLTRPYLVSEEDDVAFAGCLYLNGIRFYLVYVQAYGWPNVLGHLDGFQMPEWPRCISNIFSYAEMWKVFDGGLYQFIKNYIYIPLGGNRTKATKLLSSFACFVYIWGYHGPYFDVGIWVAMNFIQILGEVLVVKFYYSDMAKPLHSALSPAWTRRVFGLLGAWTFMFSCLGFFYFDIGYEVTNLTMKMCGSARFWLIFFLLSYFLVHLAIECRVRGLYRDGSQPASTKIEEKKEL